MIDKRIVTAIALVLVFVAAISVFINTDTEADDQEYFTVDDMRFVVTDATNLTVSVAPLESGKYETTSVLHIPASVTNDGKTYKVTGIAEKAFYATTALNAIDIPEGIVTIGDDAFNGSNIYQDLVLPSTVTEIGERSFMKATITGLDTSKTSIKTIPENAFSSCTFIKTVKLNSSLETLGVRAFQGDTKVVEFNLDELTSLKTIDDAALQNMGTASGMEITIPASVTSISESAFSQTKVTSYTVASGNTAYTSKNGCILDKDGKTLLFYPISNTAKEFVIPAGVEKLGEDAFYYCTNLCVLTIDNATDINDGLTMCSNLETLVITQSAALPEGNKGIIASYFCDDDGYWNLSNIDIYHLIIDSTYAINLTGLKAKSSDQYVDFTSQSKNTTGGNFTQDGSAVTGADRANKRFTSAASDSVSDVFAFDNQRIITTVVDPKEGGTVEAEKKVTIGEETTVKATAKSGFKFGWWNDDETLTNPTYTFKMGSADAEVTAHFIMIENCYYTVPSTATFEMTKYLGGAPENKNPSSYNYYNFQHVDPASTKVNEDGTTTYVYILENGNYGAITNGKDYVTYKQLLTKKSNTEINVTVPLEKLTPEGVTSTTVDRSLSNKQGNDVGGILISGTKSNHIVMEVGDTKDMMVYRQWQAVGNTTSNPFLEPEIVYTITDLSGTPVSDIISIENGPAGDTTWDIKALKEGTVVVTVWMKAMTLNVTTDTFFGATWPELTEVFIVTVGKEAKFDTGMTMYDEQMKTKRAIDCDIDYFYYDMNKSGYDFTFQPATGTTVKVYNPILGDNGIKGFKEGSATKDGDKWTVRLNEGRNVIEMVNGEEVRYQILMGMPVSIVVNGVDISEAVLQPGKENTVVFKSAHNPDIGGIFNTKGKLAGIYNSGATIWYEDKDGTRATTANQPAWGHYFFLTAAGYQSLTFTVPEDWDVSQKFTLYPKGVNLNGIDGNGDHRTWFTKQAGALGALRISFLPEITVRVAGSSAACEVSNDGGQTWTEYNTFKSAVEASKNGSIIRVNENVDPVEVNKNIEIRMGGNAFNDSGILGIDADVKIVGIKSVPLKVMFGNDGFLTVDTAFYLTAIFKDASKRLGDTFVEGLTADHVSVQEQGYTAVDAVVREVALFRTVDMPFGVMYQDEFVFFNTFEDAVAVLGDQDTIYILNYQPIYAGGVAKNSYEVYAQNITTDIKLKTVVRVTDGTYSSFYVDGKFVYNNGKDIPLPQTEDLSTKLTGYIHIDGGYKLTICDVVVQADVMLGGGDGTAAAVATIILSGDVPMYRLAVGFDNLDKWSETIETPEGRIYILKDGCDYKFITSDKVPLNDRIGVSAAGFKANIEAGGLSARLEASSAMVAYVQTGDDSFTGFASIMDAIEAAGPGGTVYVLYRTTNVPGDADTTSHVIDFDMTWEIGYEFDTVHQMVSGDGSTSTFIVDSKCATLIMSSGHAMYIGVDADFTRIYVEGRIVLTNEAVIDLGEDPALLTSVGATGGRMILDVTEHTPGLIIKNVGEADVAVEMPESETLTYYTYMIGNDLYFGSFELKATATNSGEITITGANGMEVSISGGDQKISEIITDGKYVFKDLKYTNYKLTAKLNGSTFQTVVYVAIVDFAGHKVQVPLGSQIYTATGELKPITSGYVPTDIYYSAEGKVTILFPNDSKSDVAFPVHTFAEKEHDGKVYDHCDCGYEIYIRDSGNQGGGFNFGNLAIAIGAAVLAAAVAFVVLLWWRGKSA